MAVEIKVRKLAPARVAAREPLPPASPPEPVALPLSQRLDLSLRRRRSQRRQQALAGLAWAGGTAALLFLAAGGVAGLR